MEQQKYSQDLHRGLRERQEHSRNDARGRLYRGRSYPLRQMQREKTDQSKNPW